MTDTNIKDIHHYECSGCGANMVFDGDCGELKCPYCGNTKEIARDYMVAERDFSDMNTQHYWDEGNVSSYRCDNCGATTMLNNTTIATSCPYCNSPVVLDTKSIHSVRPDTVVPFNIGAKRAEQELLGWRKKRFWAPKEFQKIKSIEDIKSTYMPVWTFDCDTDSSYSGRVGYNRTRTVTRDGKTTTERYIQWKNVSGDITRQFDDLMVRGSEHVPENHFGKLLPYPAEQYVCYEEDYFAGHIADNYTIPPDEAYQYAVDAMRDIILQSIQQTHHADHMGTMNINTQYSNKSFKYVMMPVYVTATSYKQRLYTTYVSGIHSNNKVNVAGDSPISALKVSIAIILAILLIGGLILALNAGGVIEIDFLAYHSIGSVDSTNMSAQYTIGINSGYLVDISMYLQ